MKKIPPYHFVCENCKRVHKKSAYCVAQQSMGHEILFKCPCGKKIQVPEE